MKVISKILTLAVVASCLVFAATAMAANPPNLISQSKMPASVKAHLKKAGLKKMRILNISYYSMLLRGYSHTSKEKNTDWSSR